MNFYIDESGNTGDLARTSADLDFGGQGVFSLAAVGIASESSLTEELAALRKKHKVQATELKLSKKKNGSAISPITFSTKTAVGPDSALIKSTSSPIKRFDRNAC